MKNVCTLECGYIHVAGRQGASFTVILCASGGKALHDNKAVHDIRQYTIYGFRIHKKRKERGVGGKVRARYRACPVVRQFWSVRYQGELWELWDPQHRDA